MDKFCATVYVTTLMWLTVNLVGLYKSDRYRMLTYNLGRDKIGCTKVVLLEELILRNVRKRRMLVNHERTHKYIASISSLLQVVRGYTLLLVSTHYSLKAGTVERCKQIVP